MATELTSDDLKKGGLWSDAALDEAIDFTGEHVGKKATEKHSETYDPQTLEEQEEQVLLESGLSEDVIAAISKRAGQYLERKLGKNVATLDAAVSHELKLRDEEIEKLKSRISLLQQGLNALSGPTVDEVRSLKEAVGSLTEKINILQQSIAERDDTIVNIGEQSRRMLSQLIELRKKERGDETIEISDITSEDLVTRIEVSNQALQDRISTLPASRVVQIRETQTSAAKKRLHKML